MIKVKSKVDFKNMEKLFKASKKSPLRILDRYGKMGVNILSSATPIDSGTTADSWGYNIEQTKNGYTINWYNTNMVGSIPLAVLIQYGHATRSGTWIEGVDYINPSIKPLFDKMTKELWEEVSK